MKIDECRGCGEAIVFLTTRGGKPIPVNAETVLDDAEEEFDESRGHVAHFAMCPEAARFRKEKRK